MTVAGVRSEPWRVITPPESARLDVPRSRRARRALLRQLQALPAGTRVVLCDQAPWSRWRCRRLASGAGIELDREYIALPSLDSPHYLIEDTAGAMSYFWIALVTVPPGTATAGALGSAGLWLTRLLRPWRTIVAFMPVRIAVGRRT